MTHRQSWQWLAIAAMAGAFTLFAGKISRADEYMAQGRALEQKEDWDGALELYQKALTEKAADLVCQMAVYRARAHAAMRHIDRGAQLRSEGKLQDAMAEFQKARVLDPGSAKAEQEVRVTSEMLQAPGQTATPVGRFKQEESDRLHRLQPAPELRALSSDRIQLKLVEQPPKILFQTLGKVAGINMLFDPEFQGGKNVTLDLTDATVSQALDQLALVTKSYWKPVSPNTIFVTNDNPNKRRDYEEMVTRTFYLANVSTPQEIQEIINAVRSVTELQRIAAFTSQYAIVARGEADKMELAGKVIRDLDKPRAETLVDFVVMQAGKTFSRQITAAIASAGLNVPVNFSPRSGLQVTSASTSSSSSTSTSTSTSSTSSSTTSAISLASLGHMASSDFSVSLPGALLQAALSDANTKILQCPQMRAIDGVKGTLKIGERQPTASGSYSAGVGTTAVSALVNTQFTYIDVGVNIELMARVHENGEISMHVELDVSSVTGQVDLGGINEPIIGQRKIVHDIRVREGEVSLLGGLTQDQESKSVTGIPGLSSIPVIRRLFSGESVDSSHSELLIVLVPHILRRPDVSTDNLRGIAVGNGTSVKLNRDAPKDAAR